MAREIRIRTIPIEKLLLDEKNPRFGGNVTSSVNQKSILSTIIQKHGISDLLASMSANGYFDAEPVVVVSANHGQFTVVEGNRRLAAALVLTKSDRASEYHDMSEKWLPKSNVDKINSIKEFPVTEFEKRNAQLIAYIGIKHIRGSKPWDSYAKAHWLFELMSVSDLELSIEEAARLVGDQNSNTVKRVLEAFVLMKQLKEEKNYNTEHSQVRGRGSNLDYPFSWVYTAIGYENIRKWIEISSLDSRDKINAGTKVLKSRKALSNGEKLIDFLFGSKQKSVMPVVKESRQIRMLNNVVIYPLAVKALESGGRITDVEEELRPVEERLLDLFYNSTKGLETINTLVAGDPPPPKDRAEFFNMGTKCKNLLNSILKMLESVD